MEQHVADAYFGELLRWFIRASDAPLNHANRQIESAADIFKSRQVCRNR